MADIKPMTWTREQQEALALKGNLCVWAGAGSGKTMTLVEMVMRLLQGTDDRESMDITQILALTYTEKAAREMRDRIRRAVNLRIRQGGSTDRLFWVRQRRLLDRASIATIHGFCLQVLRQHGLDIGLDPGFSILSEDRDFWPEMVRETLLDWIEARDPELLFLLDYFSWLGMGRGNGLDRMLLELIRRARTFGRFPVPAEAQGEDREDALGDLIRAADFIVELDQTKGLNARAAYYPLVTGFAQKVLELRSREGEITAELDRLDGMIKGNWGKAKEARALARQALDTLLAERDRGLALPIMKRLSLLADRLLHKVETVMEQRLALDFDDLLLKTRSILASRPEVRAGLKGRYRMVLVDEFQDTNRLQADIMACLTEASEANLAFPQDADLGRVIPRAAGRLVVFGDPKQSIYRFRGAEVEVFGGLKDSIMAEARGYEGLAPLRRNFRSREGLVDFFNAFFQEVLPETGGADFKAEDLQTAQRAGFSASPPVRLLLTPDLEYVSRTRAAEAVHLAGLIQDILSGREGVTIGAEAREPGLGDMVVLLRRFTHLKAYEDAFRRAGLPFYTVRGQGFYQAQEVRDLINLMAFIADPGNAPALLGVLRSPLIGLDDQTITRLAWPGPARQARPLAGYFGSDKPAWPDDLDDGRIGRLERARNLLSDLAARAGRSFPAELIETVVENTDLLAVLMTQDQGEQKVANVQKLIEITRSLPLRALFTPAETARFLARRLRDTQEDPEAQVSEEGAPVLQIMTIHQAKGLEFPIVFVPDSSASLRSERGALRFGDRDRFAISFKDPDSQRFCKPLDFQKLSQENQGRELGESFRLLYVAATRARDFLVFSGVAREKDEHSWLAKVNDFASKRPDLVRVLEWIDEDGQTMESGPMMEVQKGFLEEKEVSWSDHAPKAQKVMTRVMGQAPVQPPSVTVAVTGLAQYLTCPRRYYLETLLGLPGEQVGNGHESGSQERAGAREKGVILHGLLERLDLTDLPDQTTLARQARHRAVREGWLLADGDAEEIADRAGRFLDSDWGREMVGARDTMVQREQSLWLRVEPERPGMPALILTGEIDLFYITPCGTSRIVDYKYASPHETARYAPQLKSYALALIRSGLTRRVAAGLFFCRDQEPTLVDIPLVGDWTLEMETRLRKAAAGIGRMLGPNGEPPFPPEACPDPHCGLSYACR